MSSSSAAIRTQHLAKTYAVGFFRKKVRAIHDVSIEVRPQEIFGLLGPNGSGKTTTMKILMGLVRQTSGTAEIFGQSIGTLAVKRRIGYLPESPYFYDYLTAREFLILIGQLCGLRGKACQKRADELLEMVGLAHARNRAMRRYSKGMLQRAGLAQALINDPDLVVLDEPLTGLDPLGRKQLRTLIGDLRDQGKTVVITSHVLQDVEMLADRVAILINGHTADQGALHTLVNARVLDTEVICTVPTDEQRQSLEQAGFTARIVGDVAHLVVGDNDQLDQLIDLLRDAGISIRSVAPRKESLEDVVIREAEAEAAST